MPILFKGRPYNTVNERLLAAHGEGAQPTGITSIVTELLSLPGPTGAVIAARAVVTFADGRSFSGISEAPFDATSGPERTNPVEIAETSAVGRALAMAGYSGSEEGLAGAEEVRQAQRREAARQAPPAPGAAGGAAPSPPARTDEEQARRENAIDAYAGAWDDLTRAGKPPKYPQVPGRSNTTETILAAAEQMRAEWLRLQGKAPPAPAVEGTGGAREPAHA